MWEIDLEGQIVTFLFSLLTGAVFCLVYDVFRVLRHKSYVTGAVLTVIDILYFLLLAVFDFCFFLARSNGEIRGFVLIGQLMGFWLCRKSLSRVFYLLLMALIGLLEGLLKRIDRSILYPFSAFFAKIGDKEPNRSKKYSFFIKKRLKNHNGLVYTKEKCPQDSTRKDT